MSRLFCLEVAVLLAVLLSSCFPIPEDELPIDTLLSDEDGDGFAIESGGELPGGDCDDDDPAINPSADESCDGIDNDCDLDVDEGFDQDGDGELDARYCSAAGVGDDCDDEDATVKPGMQEACDGKDNDCDGDVDENYDLDKDGYTTCGDKNVDCDDGNAAIHPGATEVCDGVDNNCNSRIDEGFIDTENGTSKCVDDDFDGYSEDDGDCDDDNHNINPGALEVCDSIDNDCDAGKPGGGVDEDFDLDEDGWTTCRGDCDDTDPAVNPGATEICDGIDNDCDNGKPGGGVDENFNDDMDDDGYIACLDCDDHDASIYPGAEESCDGADNDCDGSVDEDFDADGDGFGGCPGQDCDDSDPDVYPGAPEVCDLIDNDCDEDLAGGGIDEGFDQDGDGYTSCDGDCDDTDPRISPDASEDCDDSIDNNCDGRVNEDVDGDGDGQTTCDGDCDDTNPDINSSTAELCDNIDNNCDGTVDDGFDTDDDGYTTCDLPVPDCDDTLATVYPGALESCDNAIDDNCNGTINETADEDGDGFSNCDGDCDDLDPAISPGATEVCDDDDDNCSGGNGDFYVGSSARADFATLQSAIDASVVTAGCSVVVAQGTYKEKIDFKGKNITLRSERGPDATIIDATGLGGSGVVFKTGESHSAVLDGFTIKGGAGTPVLICKPLPCSYYNFGGGIYISSSSPTITNNVLDGNKAYEGAGIHASSGSPITRGNTFRNNVADEIASGLIFLGVTDATVEDNIFEFNSTKDAVTSAGGQGTVQIQDSEGVQFIGNTFYSNAAAYAGGLVLVGNIETFVAENTFEENVAGILAGGVVSFSSDQSTLSDNEFLRNTAPSGGGGYYCTGEQGAVSSVLEGNLFEGNDGGDYGGGITLRDGCTVALTNNIFRENKALEGFGGGIDVVDSTVTMFNNILSNNSAIYGGGISLVGSAGSSVIQNNTFYGNLANTYGGGIYLADITPVIKNNLITYGQKGVGLYYQRNSVDASLDKITYNDLYGNPSSQTNLTGVIDARGNISKDPKYQNRYEEDFHLKPESPAINAGDPASGYDPDGSRADMGAYGGPDGGW